MPLVARASNTVRNKNILIVLMCLGFASMFGYDGFIGYPNANDHFIKAQLAKAEADPAIRERLTPYLPAFEDYAKKGWNGSTPEEHEKLSEIIKNPSLPQIDKEAWKNPFDITLQQRIFYGLVLTTAIAVWWFIHCQRRRCIADETTVSPAPGVVIPWENITLVDNNRWKSTGIVDITYKDAQGALQKAKFDDYELDREPLLQILDLLADKAVNAEFIPKEDPAPPAAEAQTPAT